MVWYGTVFGIRGSEGRKNDLSAQVLSLFLLGHAARRQCRTQQRVELGNYVRDENHRKTRLERSDPAKQRRNAKRKKNDNGTAYQLDRTKKQQITCVNSHEILPSITLASAGVIIRLYMSLFCTSSNATWNCGSLSSWFRKTMLSGRNLWS